MVMKTYQQALLVLAVSIFIVPQIALAAWWNPLSWSVWNVFKPASKMQQIQIATTTLATSKVATPKKAGTATKYDTPKDNKDSQSGSLKKQAADLTQKVNTPKAEIPKITTVTLQSGAIVEVDANGNIIRTIQETPQQPAVPPTHTIPITPSVDTAAQEKQNQINSITAECNSEINQLNQQIIDLKNSYYKSVAAIQKNPIPVGDQNGQINKLMNETNQKIEQINLQIEQVQLDCQNKINQL